MSAASAGSGAVLTGGAGGGGGSRGANTSTPKSRSASGNTLGRTNRGGGGLRLQTGQRMLTIVCRS